MTVMESRLPILEALELAKGSHKPPSTDEALEVCTMEAVAFIAGEPWSDHPQCASPVVAAFIRRYQDRVSHELRQDMKQFIVPLVGSRGTEEEELAKMWKIMEWLGNEKKVGFKIQDGESALRARDIWRTAAAAAYAAYAAAAAAYAGYAAAYAADAAADAAYVAADAPHQSVLSLISSLLTP